MVMTTEPSHSSPKKLYIKTYGCQMNVYDTTRMVDVLAPLGYQQSDSPEGADLVILNTCHIREKAEDKVFSDLGRFYKMQRRRVSGEDKKLIAVGGCVGQAVGEEIIARAPYVDMVFGSQSYHKLPEMVTKALRGRGAAVELDFPPVSKFDMLPEETHTNGKSAFLAVQEGCDKFCTFCVVPYTRGAEYSRTVSELLEEAYKLVDLGAVEITLLGQNVNGYHGAGADGKDCNLASLIASLAGISGLERIRYMTSHPMDMDDDLIAIHGSEKKLMPFLHLPVQSGSSSVLKRMNRKHTADHYMNIIHKLRAARPDIALSSDFIVGFPGETDKEFEETIRLVESVFYSYAYSFKYSPRPGTPAASDEHQLPEEIKHERLMRLQALINRQQAAFNQSTVGKTVSVLFEKDGKIDGQIVGKSPYMQSVHVKNAAEYMGSIKDVVITDAYQTSVAGLLKHDSQSLGQAA
jgi:tRNA-2-methylthio-N6-dimethylallyladenosine synthase